LPKKFSCKLQIWLYDANNFHLQWMTLWSPILEDGTDTLSRNVGKKYHTTSRNIPEERISHKLCGGSLKSRKDKLFSPFLII
jgi:hypothetical protein